MRTTRWFGMVAVLLALTALVAVPRPVLAQSGNVEPRVAPPGTEFAFFADGFNPRERVGVWINNPDGSVSDIIDADGNIFGLFADSNGRADWRVLIVRDTPAGFYQMVAQGVDSGVQVVIPFRIDPNAPSPVNFNVEPDAGPSGTEFAFFADGFLPNEQVGVWTNNPDGSVSGIVDEEGNTFALFADRNGRADWFVVVVDEPGFYQMVAYGVESGRQVVIPFRVTP